MSAFAIVAPPENQVLASVITSRFPKRFQLGPGQWVVAETGLTAQQLAERIGVDGVSGQFVVFSVAGYFGYHTKDLWEWMTLNSG